MQELRKGVRIMRIALMTNNYKPFIGGVPVSIERLARGLREQGHQVTVFAPEYEGQTEEEGVFRYKTFIRHFLGGNVLPDPFDRKIEEVFRRNSYDIIHVHHPMLIGRTAVRLAGKYRIPLVFTYHTRYEQYLSYLKWIRRLERKAQEASGASDGQGGLLHIIQDKAVPAYLKTFLRHCDFVFAPTKGMQDYLTTVCRVPVWKTDILPTGIEAHHYQVTDGEKEAVRRQFSAEGIPLFLSVSRISHEKNVEFLLSSIQRIKECYQKPFRVLMVGDGPDRGSYEKRCKELHIEEEVIFTGSVSNEKIAPYFAAADAFLFASKTETQGIVIPEAFAGGTPVYALEATGVSDMVKQGVNGYLSPEDMDIYIRNVLDFLYHRVDWSELSQNAQESAQAFREEAVAGKAIHLYNKVIAAYEKNPVTEEKAWRPEGKRVLAAK